MLTQFTAEYLHTHTRAHTHTVSQLAWQYVLLSLCRLQAYYCDRPTQPKQQVLLLPQETFQFYCICRRDRLCPETSGRDATAKWEEDLGWAQRESLKGRWKNKREKWGRETGGKKGADGEKNSIGDQEKVEKEREMEVKGEAKKQKMGTGRHVPNNICEGGRGSRGCVREKAFQTTSVPRSTSLIGGEVRGRRDLKVRPRRGDDWRCLEWRLMLLTQQADTGSSCIFYRRRNISW